MTLMYLLFCALIDLTYQFSGDRPAQQASTFTYRFRILMTRNFMNLEMRQVSHRKSSLSTMECKLKAKKMRTEDPKEVVVVFKRTGVKKGSPLSVVGSKRQPCGESDCRVCGPFIRKHSRVDNVGVRASAE